MIAVHTVQHLVCRDTDPLHGSCYRQHVGLPVGHQEHVILRTPRQEVQGK